jgi:hypothetical protein
LRNSSFYFFWAIFEPTKKSPSFELRPDGKRFLDFLFWDELLELEELEELLEEELDELRFFIVFFAASFWIACLRLAAAFLGFSLGGELLERLLEDDELIVCGGEGGWGARLFGLVNIQMT